MFFALLLALFSGDSVAYELTDHPRIFIPNGGLPALAAKARGPLAADYGEIKAAADRAVAEGVRPLENRFRVPEDLLALGICYLVEKELGHDAAPYAGAVKRFWEDGQVLGLDGSGHFGYFGMVYDWIYDGMTPEERVRYGNALGPWLRFYTNEPEITLKNGSWWYNQTWGPSHLNTRNTRDGIAPKLFTALAIAGAGTEHEADARRFLDSWASRVPAECIPAFDEMGGVWSESMGHGNYGPVAVIPWAFEGWRTATGEDLFRAAGPTGYTREMTEWAVHLKMAWCDATAWIDDNDGVSLQGFTRVSPILAARYRDGVGTWITQTAPAGRWKRVPWERFLFTDPAVGVKTPAEAGYPTARFFTGAGHLYLRSGWDDPNATWAFFGAGPRYGAHARDDEGHFLIAKRGLLVGRAGGSGHNDRDYYSGGSLAFNVVTVYDRDEEFRRTSPGERGLSEGGTKNENDGGMIRWVYNGHHYVDRARVTAFRHSPQATYAAADLTKAYSPAKVKEATRQFLYLPGGREFFVIFDRVESTRDDFPKTWFLHVSTEPAVDGMETVTVPGHVASFDGRRATWLSGPAGVETVHSQGRARAFLTTVLPERATTTRRGGEGHDFWGHPHEATAQYNHKHQGRQGDAPPVVPWRLEVEAGDGQARTYFLHVIEVGDEGDTSPAEVSLVRDGGRAGARIGKGKEERTVWFAMEGPAGAWLEAGGTEKSLGD